MRASLSTAPLGILASHPPQNLVATAERTRPRWPIRPNRRPRDDPPQPPRRGATRTGRRILFCSLDDGTGITEVTFFDHTHVACVTTVQGGCLLPARGRIRRSPRSAPVTAIGCWDLVELRAIRRSHGIDALCRRLLHSPDRRDLSAAP
ncbi:OB-fold nucleic acid binding domain-containing protein [Streptosporangium sp. CA-135522]|uniref:OB-fold nucleic acid binding domain-containing protein n=1 Tax=Streptosporangium sp. CA-135522 TaxID=3240072 RepID=UPI003D93D096